MRHANHYTRGFAKWNQRANLAGRPKYRNESYFVIQEFRNMDHQGAHGTGKQGIWSSIFPDRKTQGKFGPHREFLKFP